MEVDKPAVERRQKSLLENVIESIHVVSKFSRWTNIVCIGALFLIVILSFIDVLLRYIFSSPIKGVAEITEVMLVVTVFLGIAHTYNEKGHVSVDLFTSKLSAKSRSTVDFITTLFSLLMVAILVWQLSVQTEWFFRQKAMHSLYYPLPHALFCAIAVIGCVSLWLLILRDVLIKLDEFIRNKISWKNWVVVIGVPILTLIVVYYWMQPDYWEISLPWVGFIAILTSLLLLFSGMPIGFVFLITSFVFIGNIRGLDPTLIMIGTDSYRTVASYSWSVIPFFVLMGFFCLYFRLGEDLYFTANKWIGHYAGGLAMATIIACTLFSAVVGVSLAAIATMGSVAVPEMKKYGYDDKLISGSITGGSSIGPIIPPSVPFIMYGLLTQTSIGAMFIAGIIPGLLIAFIFCATIYAWCRIDPGVGPPAEKAPWNLRVKHLISITPVAVLFLVAIGGIYTGVFTPTEGGAIGSVVAVIIALFLGRFKWKALVEALLETGKTVSMVFLIIIGAMLFSRLIAWCDVTDTFKELMTSLDIAPSLTIAFIFAVFFFMGFVIDALPLTLIGIPIVHPIAVGLGFDSIWFGVILTIIICAGTLTPPVGLNLFVYKGLDDSTPMRAIFYGALPFVLGTGLLIILLFFFPSLVTLLPKLL